MTPLREWAAVASTVLGQTLPDGVVTGSNSGCSGLVNGATCILAVEIVAGTSGGSDGSKRTLLQREQRTTFGVLRVFGALLVLHTETVVPSREATGGRCSAAGSGLPVR